MQNYNKQQQSIILKGIAQNILQMSVPTFNELNLQLRNFEHCILTLDEAFPEEGQSFYVVHEGNSNRRPLKAIIGGKYFIAKFATKEEATAFACKECTDIYGDKSYCTVQTMVASHSNDASTFITGYSANGRYWEVHTKPTWLP